jgi:hypothetical protein
MRVSILYRNCSWNFPHLHHCWPFILRLPDRVLRLRPRLKTTLTGPKLPLLRRKCQLRKHPRLGNK